MNSFSRRLASRLAGKEIKIFPCENGVNNSYMEWLKWLSYVPEFQRTRIEELNSKMVGDLSFNELEEVYEYRNQVRMLDLFQRYGTLDISGDECLEVYDFIGNHSIHDLMLSKLSFEEMEYAKRQVQYFSQIPDDILSKKVEEEQQKSNYEKLSMVDAYIFHVISQINFKRGMDDFNRRLDSILAASDVMCPKRLEKILPCTSK